LVPGDDREAGRELALEDVQVGAADAAPGDLDDHLARSGCRVGNRRHLELARGLDVDGPHFTAPNERPRTSLSCAAQPAMRTGRHASVAAAHRLAQNWPSPVW